MANHPTTTTYKSYGEVITPARADGFIRAAYAEADETLALGTKLDRRQPDYRSPLGPWLWLAVAGGERR